MTKKQKDKIIEIIKEGQKKMYLSNWEIIVEFNKKGVTKRVMSCYCDFKYLRATINIFEDNLKDEIKYLGEDVISVFIYHELAHILSHELYLIGNARYVGEEEILDAWDRLAENISRIILNKDNLIIRN